MDIKPEAWVVSCKGWGYELCSTKADADKCKCDLETYTGKVAFIEALYGRGALDDIASEAIRYADYYPEGSDGRNTFIMFSEMVMALP